MDKVAWWAIVHRVTKSICIYIAIAKSLAIAVYGVTQSRTRLK